MEGISEQLGRLLEQIVDGLAEDDDLQELIRLSRLLQRLKARTDDAAWHLDRRLHP